MTDEPQQNSRRSCSVPAVGCLALTPKVLSDLQVCLSTVELLDGMSLPAEAHLPLTRLTRAVDALVAAAAAAAKSARLPTQCGGAHE